jgi:hypothetical protein
MLLSLLQYTASASTGGLAPGYHAPNFDQATSTQTTLMGCNNPPMRASLMPVSFVKTRACARKSQNRGFSPNED